MAVRVYLISNWRETMSESQFATAINCMDGRVQLPVIQWMKEQYSVQYVDMITEAGPNKVLTRGTPEAIESIKSKVEISCQSHGSKVVAVVGHHGCAGYPVTREQKCAKIKKSIELIHSWGFPVKVVGLYVNENWEIEPVTE